MGGHCRVTGGEHLRGGAAVANATALFCLLVWIFFGGLWIFFRFKCVGLCSGAYAYTVLGAGNFVTRVCLFGTFRLPRGSGARFLAFALCFCVHLDLRFVSWNVHASTGDLAP